MTRRLTDEDIGFILDFLQPKDARNIFQVDVVRRQRKDLINQLKNSPPIYPECIQQLKQIIYDRYHKALITPGESIGIITAQSIGELITQSTLNSFHTTGIDTGNTSGMERFQDLINVSKKDTKNKYPGGAFSMCLFLQRTQPLTVLRELIYPKLVNITFSKLMANTSPIIHRRYVFSNYIYMFFKLPKIPYDCTELHLSKELLFKYRIYMSEIKLDARCVYEPVALSGAFVRFWILKHDIPLNISLRGLPDINDMHILKSDEYYVKTQGGSLSSVNHLHSIFNLNRSYTTSIWDVYNTLGLEAAKRYLIKEIYSLIPYCDIGHIKLLVDGMTYSGVLSPITRYTMRTNTDTFHRASFEESFDAFLKAAKYCETDPLSGVSAAVIFGKKPHIGTYMANYHIDIAKLEGRRASRASLSPTQKEALANEVIKIVEDVISAENYEE